MRARCSRRNSSAKHACCRAVDQGGREGERDASREAEREIHRESERARESAKHACSAPQRLNRGEYLW